MSALAPNTVAFSTGGPASDTVTLPQQATTPTPVPDSVVVFGSESAGRVMAAMVGPSGLDTRLQPHIGLNRIAMWGPNGSGNTQNTSIGGFWGAPTLTSVPMSDTPFGRIRKAAVATTTTAGNSVGLTSSAAYSRNSGFHMIGHFAPWIAGNNSVRRLFVGMGAVQPTSVDLTTYAGIGVHAQLGQANLQIRGINGVETDLGPGFPANVQGVWYRLEFFCPPGGSEIGWRIRDMLGTADASGVFSGAQVPAASDFLAIFTRIMTTSSVAQTMALGNWTIETDL